MEWNESDSKRALERMRERASCRSFEDRSVPEELLEDILKTGLTAASGGNLQPFSIIVIKDAAERERLCDTCGKQGFIAQAPVNLLFVLDWHKFNKFAAHEKAPFTCPDSFMHYVIALEDVMCAAQTIETAAWLCGLGSCYVGTTNHVGSQLISMYNLPEYTYPVVLLSIGYPKTELRTTPKLDYDFMVFNEKYPDLDGGIIAEKFNEKYAGRVMKLPADAENRNLMLNKLRDALLTTYNETETDEIIAKAEADGQINETQRRFGLHYHAAGMRHMGKEIIAMMEANGLTFFNK